MGEHPQPGHHRGAGPARRHPGRRVPERLARLLAVLLAVTTGLLAGTAAPSTAAAPELLVPETMSVGTPLYEAHLEGRVLVNGVYRTALGGNQWKLLGSVADGHLVRAGRSVVLVTRGRSRRLATGARWASLTADGAHLMTPGKGSRIQFRDPVSGRLLFTRSAGKRGGWAPGAVRGNRVLVSFGKGPSRWVDRATGGRSRASAWGTTLADVGTDRLVLADPRSKPGRRCGKVVRLSRPRETLWSWCNDQPVAFSPDGASMLTVQPPVTRRGTTQVRWKNIADGAQVGAWRSRWAGGYTWDLGRPAFLVGDQEVAAWVTCTPTGCLRASALWSR